MGNSCVQIGFIALTLSYWSLEVQPVGISLRLQGKLGFPYNVKQLMVKYVLLC